VPPWGAGCLRLKPGSAQRRKHKTEEFMNNTENRLSIRLLMELKGLKFKDFESDFSKATIAKILYARSNVTDDSLTRFDKILGTNGLIHLLFAIDRLWVIGEPHHVNIDPDSFEFPKSIPPELQREMVKHHPLFNKNGLILMN